MVSNRDAGSSIPAGSVEEPWAVLIGRRETGAGEAPSLVNRERATDALQNDGGTTHVEG